jgi:hypothetical protein
MADAVVERLISALYRAMDAEADRDEIERILTDHGCLLEFTQIDVVFAGSGPNLTFVEVESPPGRSVGVGEWVDTGDGYKRLRLGVPAFVVRRGGS